MEQLRQGLGKTRPIHGEMPTTNVDGSPYAHGPEDFFRYYVTNDKALITDPARFDELIVVSPPIAAELSGGVFDNEFDVDAGEPGQWFITYSTVNVDNGAEIEGPINRTPLELEVLPPLVAPSPPTNLSLG